MSGVVRFAEEGGRTGWIGQTNASAFVCGIGHEVVDDAGAEE